MSKSSVLSYTCFKDIQAFGQFDEIEPKYSQITCRDTQKKSKIFRVKAFCVSSYTCLTGIQVLEQFSQTGPGHPKSSAGRNKK